MTVVGPPTTEQSLTSANQRRPAARAADRLAGHLSHSDQTAGRTGTRDGRGPPGPGRCHRRRVELLPSATGSPNERRLTSPHNVNQSSTEDDS